MSPEKRRKKQPEEQQEPPISLAFSIGTLVFGVVVIGVGDGLVDMFTLLTPQRLEQHFLILGAELPEPTANVTSVIWPGATYRGTGLSTSGGVDATAVTAERAEEAITAGVASVLHDLTGIVLNLR